MPEREHDRDDALRPAGECVRDLTFGTADAGIVDEQDGPLRCEWVDEKGVPVIHRAAEVDVHQKGDFGGRSRAEDTVGVLGAADGDELVRGGFVGRHICVGWGGGCGCVVRLVLGEVVSKLGKGWFIALSSDLSVGLQF